MLFYKFTKKYYVFLKQGNLIGTMGRVFLLKLFVSLVFAVFVKCFVEF